MTEDLAKHYWAKAEHRGVKQASEMMRRSAMTEHLPECWAKHESDPPAWCICDKLRACEARVIAAAVRRVEELTIPHHFSTKVTLRVWSQVTAECIAAIGVIKGDK